MKIEKLPSGAYRVRKTINKHTYQRVFHNKPTKKEIDEAFFDIYAESNKNVNSRSFEKCAEEYIKTKSNILSPASSGEYTLKIKRLSNEFRSYRIDSIGKVEIQTELNRMAEKLAPKTVKDMYGFINAVLKMFQTDYRIYQVTLPQPKKSKPYIPTDKDIKRIIEASEGTLFDLAIKLGCYGLRRSEICCISSADIEKIKIQKKTQYILHINKALVENKSTKEWVVKSTKTTESERDIIIDKILAEEIISRGKAYQGYPGSISNWLRKTQNKLGMKNFSLHKERHYFATELMKMGYNQKDIQKMGGWSTPDVLERIYQHEQISEDLKKQQQISARLSNKLS